MATASTPIAPLAPERLSTTTGWPSCGVRLVSMMRTMTSVALPAGNGMTRRIERSGHDPAVVLLCARARIGDVMAKVGALVRQNAHAGAKAELQEVEARYKRLAGFDAETLNSRASWSVRPDAPSPT